MKKGFITEIALIGVAILSIGAFLMAKDIKKENVTLGANQKISELTSYTSPTQNDVFPITDVTNSATKKITIGNLFNYLTGTTTYAQDISFRNATGTLTRLENGSVSLPSFGFTNDVDTGIYRNGTNGLGLAGGGSGVTWDGSAFYPNTDAVRSLGQSANRWLDFHAVNSTTTNATSTSFFTTTASSTNLFGGGLSPCSGSNFLQWASTGRFSCASSSGVTSFATTSVQNLATTSIPVASLPTSNNLLIKFITPDVVGSGATSSAQVIMAFNYATDSIGNAYGYSRLSGATQGNVADAPYVTIIGAAGAGTVRPLHFAEVSVTNVTGQPKFGTYNGWTIGTSTAAMSFANPLRSGIFAWATTTKATSIDFWWDQANVLFATSTRIEIIGY